MMDAESVAKLIVELGALKLTPRSGWFKAGIKMPESVAEHSFRTAVIAYAIARLEGLKPLAAGALAFLALLHDSHEVRTLDLHKIAKKYVRVDEERVRKEQLSPLNVEELTNELNLSEDYVKALIRDADRLELLIQAREYSQVYPLADFEVDCSEMKTNAGRELCKALKEVELKWW